VHQVGNQYIVNARSLQEMMERDRFVSVHFYVLFIMNSLHKTVTSTVSRSLCSIFL